MEQVRVKYRDRAWTAFERAVEGMQRDFDVMISEFAAAGRTGAGATIRIAVRIFEQHTADALDRTFDETAKLIEHRGKQWDAAIAGISDALDQHLARACEALSYPLRVGNRDGHEDDAASRRTDELLRESRVRLEGRISDFRDGWTAPVPKMFKDRHPFWYAVLLLLIGALIGFGLSLLKEQLAATQAAASTEQPSQ